MTNDEEKLAFELIEQLRTMGIAVVAFFPSETEHCDLEELESYLGKQGNEYLEMFNPEAADENAYEDEEES